VSSFPKKRFTVLLVVVSAAWIVLVSLLVLSKVATTNRNLASARAAAQIKALSAGIAYYTDNGAYPRNADTDMLDPRTDLIAGGSGDSKVRYERPCRHLYRELTGDREPPESPDGRPESDAKAYYSFARRDLAFTADANGTITLVRYLRDPYGNCYGYSTAGIAGSNPSSSGNSTAARGYNTTTFDLWSTAADDRKKWVKNWP